MLTLRARIIFTFIGVVTISVVIAFIIYSLAFSGPTMRHYQEEGLESSAAIVDLYAATNPEDEEAFLNGVAQIMQAHLRLYDADGSFREYGDPDTQTNLSLNKEEIASILGGQQLVKTLEGYSCDCEQVTGIRLDIHDQPYALIVIPIPQREYYTVPMILGIVLAVGSGLLLFASRYLVRPVLQLTAAARQMSKGNLQVRLPDTRRRDEIGVMSRTFNGMAEQLERLDVMRQQFVSNVSHELQSPLTAMKGFASMLRSASLDKQDTDRALRIIHEESDRLSRLSDNLLMLATLDAGRCPIDPDPIQLDEQLRRAVLMLEPLWDSKRLIMDVQLPSITIEGNSALLEQVWINLLGNAIKYTAEDGTISVTCDLDPKHIAISITDNGIGIPPDALDRIFERFYKVDDSRNRSIEGNGLGLAIVRHIVLLHNGSLKVESTPGVGSTFTVVLERTYS